MIASLWAQKILAAWWYANQRQKLLRFTWIQLITQQQAREDVRKFIKGNNIESHVAVPEDGETITL